jgi:hypothetical protein
MMYRSFSDKGGAMTVSSPLFEYAGGGVAVPAP